MTAPAGTAHDAAVAYWRRVFDGLTGFIACFSGVRRGGRLARVRERFYPYPHAAGNAAAWLRGEAAGGREVYAAANLCVERKRAKATAGAVAALWCDGDGAVVPPGFPPPTLSVETSRGRWNYLWLLSRAIPPTEAEELNRRIAYAIGADRGGWDLGQLLRVPGFPNRKYPDAPLVGVVADDGPVHDPDDLRAALPPAPAVDRRPAPAPGATPAEDDDPPPVRLSARGLRAWRGAECPTTDAGAVDRSEALWQIGCLVEEGGGTVPTIAAALADRDERLGWRKYADRPAMYRELAVKIAARERAPHAEAVARPATVEGATRPRDALEGLRAINRALIAVVRSEATPAAKIATIEWALEAHRSRPDDFTSVGAVARRVHQSEDSVGATLAALRTVVAPDELRAPAAPDEPPFRAAYVSSMVNPWTGEVTEQPHTYLKLAPARADLAETLAAFAADVPAALRKRPRADRGRPAAPPAIPAEAIPPCPDDGDAGAIQRQEAVRLARCEDCGEPLAAMTEDDRLLLPRPEIAGVGHEGGGCGADRPVVSAVGAGAGDRAAWVAERVRRASVRAELARLRRAT